MDRAGDDAASCFDPEEAERRRQDAQRDHDECLRPCSRSDDRIGEGKCGRYRDGWPCAGPGGGPGRCPLEGVAEAQVETPPLYHAFVRHHVGDVVKADGAGHAFAQAVVQPQIDDQMRP